MNQWNELALKYGLNASGQKHILWPNLTRILRPIFAHTNVLDVGCGNGNYSRYFHEKKANVIGIDSSIQQINLAKKINPGPDYYHSSAQEFNSSTLVDNIFSNMVICNIPSNQDLISFFENMYRNSTKKSKLFITNVAPEFQKESFTHAQIHNYPEGISEGIKFEVSLGTENGDTIGPFTNYHWSKQKILNVAKDEGWNIENLTTLKTTKNDEEMWPTMLLYEFNK